MKIIKVEGYKKFCKKIAELEKEGKDIIVNFSGSAIKTRKSWCPDCVEADPIIQEVLKSLPDSVVYLYVGVGSIEEFSKCKNPFRKDPKIKLKCVPTLMRWNKSARLEDKDCSKKELLQLFLEGDD